LKCLQKQLMTHSKLTQISGRVSLKALFNLQALLQPPSNIKRKAFEIKKRNEVIPIHAIFFSSNSSTSTDSVASSEKRHSCVWKASEWALFQVLMIKTIGNKKDKRSKGSGAR
jgi:hypothetical protein